MPPVRALRESLTHKLRREPFRPILVEDIRLLSPEAEPARIHISRDGYRTLYRNAFTFTENGSLCLTPFEVGFFLERDGSVRPHDGFRAYRRTMRMLLVNGLAEVHSDACRAWEEKSRGRFDPNDQDNVPKYGWGRLIDPPMHIESMLSVEQRIVLGYPGVLPFIYHDGFAACCVVPEEEGAFHTHTVTHSDPDAYFPSEYDDKGPVVWLVLDVCFIKARLADTASAPERRIQSIMDHHTEGMARAVCVGSKMDDDGLKVLVNSEK